MPAESPLVLKIALLHPDARLPTKAHDGDAAFDLTSVVTYELQGGVARIPTGIAVDIPDGWFAQILGRSSHANRGISVLAGCIDSGYRGEWIVCLYVPIGPGIHIIRRGDRIAQFVLHKVPRVVIEEAGELSTTTRGAGGFGSSGR